MLTVGVGHSLWVLLDVFSALLMISKLKTINDTHSPMETSLMISAAVCVPCTRARVHDDRSQWVSTRKMWDSMPRPVPVRVANTRSEPWAGELRALPEWTSLGRHDDTGKENVIEGRKTEEGSFYFPITQTTYLMILQLIPCAIYFFFWSTCGNHNICNVARACKNLQLVSQHVRPVFVRLTQLNAALTSLRCSSWL